MSKTVFIFLCIGCVLLSCKSRNEKLIGHWHEYHAQGSDSTANHCYIINESMVAIDSFTMGGHYKLTDYEPAYQDLMRLTFYPQTLIDQMVVKPKKVVFGDSLIWRRQIDDVNTFLHDFSIGKKLKIIPFETDSIPSPEKGPLGRRTYIYVGKVKQAFIDEAKGIYKDEYYLQLNDQIATLEKLARFVFCLHCDVQATELYIHADRNVPITYLKEIEAELSKLNININEKLFYLHVHKESKAAGYIKTTADGLR